MARCGCRQEKQDTKSICLLWCHLSCLPDDFLGILRWVSGVLAAHRQARSLKLGAARADPTQVPPLVDSSGRTCSTPVHHAVPGHVPLTLIPVIAILGNKKMRKQDHFIERKIPA